MIEEEEEEEYVNPVERECSRKEMAQCHLSQVRISYANW